jgi:putative acetyltransferase
MATANPKLALRPFLPADTPMLADIFRESVMDLTGDDYSEAQREAWVSRVDDLEAFAKRLGGQLSLIGTLQGSPVGFASLAGGNKIDLLYVHPVAAGQGVGNMLVDALEKLARARGAEKLIADASDSARGFFEKRGYVGQQRNSISVGDEWLANTTMHKQLATKTEAS